MKKIPEQTIIGRQGVNLIERFVLAMSHAWNETTVDAGIDGRIELCDPRTREALNLIILVQSKATVQQRLPAETQGSFEWPCENRDIEYWMQGNAPVILIVSRIREAQEEAYWVDVKRYFADPKRRIRARVVFDKMQDRFDASCSNALIDLAKPIGCGIYLGPPLVREHLYSNLLRVTHISPKIYTAQTEIADNKAAWDRFRELGQDPPGGEFVVRGKQVLSFHDLSHKAFSFIYNTGTEEEHDSELGHSLTILIYGGSSSTY